MNTEIYKATVRQAVYYQLVYNFFPPYPAALVDPCIDAIEATNEGDPERLINLPDGITCQGADAIPASQLIDYFNLFELLETNE